jgi:predicted transcriptional regulator
MKGYSVSTRTLSVKLPIDLCKALDAICNRLRLQKNSVVEAAIREKLENLADAENLRDAVKQATGFHAWEDVKAEVIKTSPK